MKLAHVFAGLLVLGLFSAVSLAQPRPKILGIAGVTLRVSDLAKARAFYCDFLGYTATPDPNIKPQAAPELNRIRINDTQSIRLYPGLEPDQDRLSQIAFYIDDAEALRALLTAHGIPFRSAKGARQVRVAGPGGFALLFRQPDPFPPATGEKPVAAKGQAISNHLRHVGFIVTDAEAALKFYRDILGFKETWRGSANGKTLSYINMKLPDGGDYIELMLYAAMPPMAQRGSPNHLCLDVPDMAQAVAELQARPYAKTLGAPLSFKVGLSRRRLASFFDPDGTRTEVMEPTTIDGHPTPSSTAPFPK